MSIHSSRSTTTIRRTSSFAAYVLLFLALTGCVGSLVYSPSTLMPARPLKKDSGQILGGFVMLPETNPNAAKRNTAPGGEVLLRYAFTDRVTLQTKAWSDFSYGYKDWRSGCSLGGIVALGDSNDDYRLGLLPTVGAVLLRSSIEGGGSSLLAAFWLPHNPFFYPYLGAGPVVGFRNLSMDAGHRPEWGWGVLSTIGIALKPLPPLQITLEANGIIARDEYNQTNSSIISPSISFGMDF